MTAASDNDYKVEFTYGVIGLSSQVYEEKQSYVGGSAHTKTVRKTRDAAGNVITELYPSGLDLDRTWNDIGQLSTVTDGTNTIASYAYVGTRVKKVTFESGATASYTFTGLRNEIERIHHETSTPTTILDLQYGYDKNHDRTYERYGGTSASGDAFEYDWARRLDVAWMGSTNVTAPSSNSYTKKVEYTMDDDGNRSSVKVTPYGQSATTTSYTDNNLNQYTNVGSSAHTHDKNGNLTDDGTQQYEYDYRNHIVRIKQSSTTIAEYKYDALGRRVEKDDQISVERYIYSDAETVSVYTGSQVWKRDFVFGQVIDEVLMLEQADVLDFDSDLNTTETTRSFYHRNALGSVMEITDMNEATVVSYRYDPYGGVTITRNSTTQSSDPLGNPWMYTGRFHDHESGLEYYRARYYSASTGRFLQRDPIGVLADTSLYVYASGRPSVLVDPSGLKAKPLPKKAKKALDSMSDCKKAASPAACKVCCEKAAHKASTAADRMFKTRCSGCYSKYPLAAAAVTVGNAAVVGKELLGALRTFQAVAGAVSAIGTAATVETATDVATAVVEAALEEASGAGDEAADQAEGTVDDIVAAWTTAAGGELTKLAECLKRAGSDHAAWGEQISDALAGCLDDCRTRWEDCTYKFPTDDASWIWTRNRARKGKPIHEKGDESGQKPFGD